jgi:parallel beta-helix repeat protein
MLDGEVFMKRNFIPFTFIVIFFHMLFIQSCVVATKKTAITTQLKTMFEGTYKVDPYMEKHKPHTVAILPFVDKSRSQKGTETVRRHFYNHFSSLPFKDMELYRVDHLLRKAGLTDPEAIQNTKPQDLAKILNVDAVIYGTISNFDKMFAVVYSQVSVGAEIEMYETKTGHFLWNGQHVTRIQEGGVSTTPIGVIATIIATSMNIRDIQLLRACDDLFRDMVKTIPVPSLAEASHPPVITILTQDTQGEPRKAGDVIKVVMKATPEMQAYFDIGEFKKGIDMKEIEPGGYLGTYRVVPGDTVEKAIITGHVTDDTGNTANWIDAISTVTLDTTPPDKPVNMKTVGRDTFVLLDWDKNADSDLAGYRIYRSLTPLSGFTSIAQTEFNHYKDENLENTRTYFYRLSAVDGAGNESEKTEAVTGMPMAPGPTPVSGTINADTIWYTGASPYIIDNKVVVKDKAHLTIEPGTVIQSKGSPLVIEGCLHAVGDGEHFILFQGTDNSQWDGLIYNNVQEKDNVIKFARIKNARTGILCRASSPIIEDCELTACMDGIKIVGAFSKPSVTRNIIHKNESVGIIIDGGSAPKLTFNKIRDNERGGITITNAEPVIQNNSIIQNNGSGITLQASNGVIAENNINDNNPFNIVGIMEGEPVRARNNWWGSTDGLEILSKIRGKVDIRTVLNSEYPGGTSLELPILESELGGTIQSDSYLTLSNSPYNVVRDLMIDGGFTLYIEPGVTITYDQNKSIITNDGAVIARGMEERPIVFTASGKSPSPGFYSNAVRFAQDTKANSFFTYCIVKYAKVAFDVQFGSPEISYCYVAKNAQSGVRCQNHASPKISYNTFAHNRGEGAIQCYGSSTPVIHYNNFIDNDINVQPRSSIHIDARNNWWGSDPPDNKRFIFETNITIEPWLKAPEKKAFERKE